MLTLFGIDPWIALWVILLVGFVVGELITISLTSIWFAAGSLIELLAAVIGLNPIVQIIFFLLVSLCMLAATRSWANKYINSRTQSTNADRIIGESIRIAERVSNLDQTGMAVVHGQEWTVGTRYDNETIEVGEVAKVLGISGVKLIVEKE